MSSWLEQTAGRRADGTPLHGSPDAAATSVSDGAAERRSHAALVTTILIAILVVSAALATTFGFLVFSVGLDAYVGNISGYLGFLLVYTLLWLGAVEVAAAAVLTLAQRRSRPGSYPSRDSYFSLARSVAIAVGCVGGLACLGMLAGVIVGAIPLAQALVFGLAGVTGVVWLRRHRHGRVTTLRTRSFVVIVVAMVVPCIVLSVLGISAYLLSWDKASTLYWDQAAWGARMLNNDVRSLGDVPGDLDAAAESRLSREIVRAFADDNRGGSLRSTMGAMKTQRVLPRWAIRSLERSGYAIGMIDGDPAARGTRPDVVAWRVGRQDVRYFRSDYFTGPGTVDAPPPYQYLGRLASAAAAGIILVLVLGLIGAWILSRSVVRPVRRLAAASGRLAEGEAGVTVTPEGPRELRELAVSFNDMNGKLEKAQETEQAFLLSVSHELKTPLTSIRGYAEGIGDGTVKSTEGASVIGAESSRLERLVGDLLESGRMRKSAFSVRREPVDLVAVAEDVARRYEATALDAGLTLLLNVEAGGGATADHDRVVQVVSNLVENAIRCTPAPGTVTITTAPGAISVSDTGRGLTSDDLPRTFERFYLYSRYGTDRPVGTGLGLAIVKELTEAMAGEVRVSSAVGVGTAFNVALPPGETAAPDADTAVTIAHPAEVVTAQVAAPAATTAASAAAVTGTGAKDDDS